MDIGFIKIIVENIHLTRTGVNSITVSGYGFLNRMQNIPEKSYKCDADHITIPAYIVYWGGIITVCSSVERLLRSLQDECALCKWRRLFDNGAGPVGLKCALHQNYSRS